MIYFFDESAGDANLTIKGEMYKYLVKVRRHTLGDILQVRDKKSPEQLYRYRVDAIEPRKMILTLLSSEISQVKPPKELHIGWCIIDTKSVEKVLPSLCEIGVSRISFISCERSQKSFKQDFNRYERIVDASMQQSGRSSRMEFDTYKDIKSFIEAFPETKVFDFTEKSLEDGEGFEHILIGCEGGFSPDEKEYLASQEVFRLNTPMVLRSESAVLAVASKILL